MFETDFLSSAYYRGEKRTKDGTVSSYEELVERILRAFKVDVLTKTRVFAVCKEHGTERVACIERIKVNEINFVFSNNFHI